MLVVQSKESNRIDSSPARDQVSPSWRRPEHSTSHDRFRQIFLDHWHIWCDLRLEEVPYDQRNYVCEIIQCMLLCRDPDAGFARYVCPGCQYEHRVPFSCKTRFCPSCGKVRVDNWVNDISRDLLEVPHLHITLTTDDLLRPSFHTDRSLLKVLLKVAPQAIREVLDELYPGVRVGLVYTVHTAGRDLGFKPHVHLVMTKGRLKDGKWVEIDGIPAARLSAKWRYLLCKHLRQARPHDQELRQAIEQGYRDHRGFQVHTDSFYPKGLDAAQYIGRYLGHPPLATSHITHYDGQQVTYWYIDTDIGQRITVTCSALDFISRYAGLYARNVKRKIADIVRDALDALSLQIPLLDLDSLARVFRHLTWRERINASFGYDPLKCPRCGQIMKLVEIWGPKRGFVWMKRWLETHRQRKAARLAMQHLRANILHYRQLAFDLDTS